MATVFRRPHRPAPRAPRISGLPRIAGVVSARARARQARPSQPLMLQSNGSFKSRPRRRSRHAPGARHGRAMGRAARDAGRRARRAKRRHAQGAGFDAGRGARLSRARRVRNAAGRVGRHAAQRRRRRRLGQRRQPRLAGARRGAAGRRQPGLVCMCSCAAAAPRADAAAGRWRSRGAQMGEDDEFELEPGELAFQFGAAASEHYSASGLRAALAAGTPGMPGGGTFSPPPPPAPRKGATSFPSRVQARGSRCAACRSQGAVAAAQPR